MKIQCHCGAAINTLRRKFAGMWLYDHGCPGQKTGGSEPDDEEPPFVAHAGTALAERSFQEPPGNGGYQYTPDVNAKIKFGFQLNQG